MSGKVARAFGWNFFSAFITRIGALGVGVMLARLLGPDQFGIYAVASLALVAAQMFNELGMSLAIVRWESDPAQIMPTVNTVSVILSALIFAGCYFAAPAYSAAMGVPAATSVVRVVILAILIDGFVNTPSGLLQREFREGRRALALQVGNWTGTVITIALALSGYGALSLAIGRVVGSLLVMILMIAFAPGSLRFGFDPAKARQLFRFGLPLAGSNLVGFIGSSVDQIVVGHMLGPVSLGFYTLAQNLSSWPTRLFSSPVTTVAPAMFSRLQGERGVMGKVFLSGMQLLCSVTLPLFMLIGGSAGPLIGAVYGTRWLPSARPLLWLALAAAMSIVFDLCYAFLAVLARSRFLLMVRIVWLAALIPALVGGIHVAGIFGAGVALAVVAAAVMLPCYVVELARVGIRRRDLLKSLRLPVFGAALVGILAASTPSMIRIVFAALAVNGLIALVIVMVLAYRMRAAFSLLRASSAGAAGGAAAQSPPPPAPGPDGAVGPGEREVTDVIAELGRP